MWSVIWSKVVDFMFETEDEIIEVEIELEEDENDYDFMNRLFNQTVFFCADPFTSCEYFHKLLAMPRICEFFHKMRIM